MRVSFMILFVGILVLAGCSDRHSVTGTDPSGAGGGSGMGDAGDAHFDPPDQTLQPKRLSSDDRQAVVLECFYALRPYSSTAPYKSVNGYAVSEWNYLTSDMDAYRWMVSAYGGRSGGLCSDTKGWGYMLYDDPGRYGIYQGYGRLGQCPFGANLLVYRSGTYRKKLPTYSTCRYDYDKGVTGRIGARKFTKPVGDVEPGDLIRTCAANGHTAIVVKILSRKADGSALSVDVIDSNFVGSEMIGMHPLTRGDRRSSFNLDNYYAIDLAKLKANT